jgi:hypothetical protein
VIDSPALVLPSDEWHDEFVASDALISRLHRATEVQVLDLIASLSPHQRAGLAAFCYRRSHLHGVGLMIAATCDQVTLIQVLGTAVGTVMFNQSRERKPVPDRAPGSHRPKITLAKIQGHVPPPDVDPDEALEESAETVAPPVGEDEFALID